MDNIIPPLVVNTLKNRIVYSWVIIGERKRGGDLCDSLSAFGQFKTEKLRKSPVHAFVGCHRKAGMLIFFFRCFILFLLYVKRRYCFRVFCVLESDQSTEEILQDNSNHDTGK